MTREAAGSSAGAALRRSERNRTTDVPLVRVKQEEKAGPASGKKAAKRGAPPPTPTRRAKRIRSDESHDVSPSSKVHVKAEPGDPDFKNGLAASPAKAGGKTTDKAAELQARKLKAYARLSQATPFPDFAHPTPAECRLAHRILAQIHGDRVRPAEVAAPADRAGCGDSSSVLDALVRTILSQNTSNRNSTRAKLSMDAAYGGSDQWEAIVAGGQAKLQRTIESGGLSRQKSRVILHILTQARERHGAYSLDHLFGVSDDEAMREMLGFQGVGPKTASCVLLFCLRRSSFAVDTHVYRITGLLGWRPAVHCSREEAQAHLDARVPDEEKYALHILLVTHGRTCEECRAGGRSLGKCALRKAFRAAKAGGAAGEEIQREGSEQIKREDEEEESKDMHVGSSAS